MAPDSTAFRCHTKSVGPRTVHLLIEQLPQALERRIQRVFDQGRSLLYLLQAARMIGCDLPQPEQTREGKTPLKRVYELNFVDFHKFCHTYVTWVPPYGGRDTKGLVGTGRWKSEQSASRYAHVVPGEDAMAAIKLPVQRKITS